MEKLLPFALRSMPGLTALCLGASAQARPKPATFSSARPSWSAAQATGEPDTKGGGDHVNAWAPQSANAGIEWLELGYLRKVQVTEVLVLQNHNPGAIVRITAFGTAGEEVELWAGQSEAGGGPKWFSAKAGRSVFAKKIRIYLDTKKVAGWNEIDAVKLMDDAGGHQWAISARASSSYGQYAAMRAAGPLSAFLDQTVRIQLASGAVVGRLVEVQGKYLKLIDSKDQRVLMVRAEAIEFLEAPLD